MLMTVTPRRSCSVDFRIPKLYIFPEEKIQTGVKSMARKGKRLIEAVAYMRTSSLTNVGADKDSEKRQRAAIESYGKAAGYVIVEWFYDVAVKGSDPVTARPGFAAMLDRIAGNGVRTVLVESPDRFARDLAVQLAGHDYLKRLGVDLIPTSAPDFFIEDTPSAVLIRQVLGAVAEFQKTDLVVKLRAARERKRKETGKCGGRKSYAERDSERDRTMLAKARELSEQRPRLSLRQISAELQAAGYVTPKGNPYAASAVASMLAAPFDVAV
jgi:DNA invertase Pin-like site-specific DNA recombinase